MNKYNFSKLFDWLLILLLALVVTIPEQTQGAGGGKPQRNIYEFEGDFEDPGLAGLCGIESVLKHALIEEMELGFPNATRIRHISIAESWTNPATGSELHLIVRVNQTEEFIETWNEEMTILTVQVPTTVSGTNDRLMWSKEGLIINNSGRFTKAFTYVVDFSGGEPVLIDFSEVVTSEAGTILDGYSDEELSEICLALDGAFNPD